jgi:hypothetical protein
VPSNSLPALESHLRFATGGKLAGFIAEPVQGRWQHGSWSVVSNQ